MDDIYDKVSIQLQQLTEYEKSLKKELKTIKKLCDIRSQDYNENEEYIKVQGYLLNLKKEIKIYKKIKKLILQLC